jgi:hypothetical protein
MAEPTSGAMKGATHAEQLAAPVRPLVDVELGHGVQERAPTAEKKPAAHGAQRPVAESQYWPALQPRQSAEDCAPGALVVPLGQLMHAIPNVEYVDGRQSWQG